MFDTMTAQIRTAPRTMLLHCKHLPFKFGVLVGLPVTLLLATAASGQQPCTTTDTCAAVPEMSQDMVQNRFGRTFATTPTQDRITNRLNTKTWQADDSVPTPFSMQDAGSGTKMETSLQKWRAALSKAERKRLEEAKEKGEDLKMPAAIRHRAPPVDVWVHSQIQSLDASGDTRRLGDAVTTYAGADYRVNSDVLVGGMVQADEANLRVDGAREKVHGKAYMAGPYAAYRVTDKVIVDGKTLWGQAQDTALVGENAATYGATRSLSQARVSGNWAVRKMQVMPSGAITHVTEGADIPVGGVDSDKFEETRISIRPEIKRPFQAGEDRKIEPFAYFESSLSVDDTDFTNASPANRIGGGLALTKTDDYSIRASADYTETMNSEIDPSVAGRFSVNVPLGKKPY